MEGNDGRGPLAGLRVIEIASLAPGPFAACLLADMGADVVRVDRPGGRPPFSSERLDRGKRSVAIDLKDRGGAALALDLVAKADMLIEGFRPGVMERLGLGPEECLSRRPALVYGRMTGFGQDGPLAGQAGHDINYIAMSGVLCRIGRAGQPPSPPLNLVGDFGGGSLFLVFGMLCALHEAQRSGRGQVVDAAMTEGSGYLMLPFFGGPAGERERAAGAGRPPRGTNLLDSGAPFYDAYETADGRWMAVGAIEPQFYAALLAGLGLSGRDLPGQFDSAHWPEMKALLAARFRSRRAEEWEEIFAGTDACVTAVLDLDEVAAHPQHRARRSYGVHHGVLQPEPAPRLSRTPGRVGGPPPGPGRDSDEVLGDWLGLAGGEVGALRAAGALG